MLYGHHSDKDLFRHVTHLRAVVDKIAVFTNFMMARAGNGIHVVIFCNCPNWTGLIPPDKDEYITERIHKKECCH